MPRGAVGHAAAEPMVISCAALPSDRCRRAERPSWERISPWKTAPITATPRVPPIMRFIDRMPEAMPAFASATAFMAAVDIGDIISAMPTPISMKPGSRSL